jgi:hypothetical protein
LFLCPLDDRNLDRLIGAARERRGDLIAFERDGDPLPLELEATVVDRPRYIDCEHKGHIGLIGSSRCAGRHL